jgi:hypothetical protein
MASDDPTSWSITGIDRATGERVTQTLTAQDAQRLGLLTYGVDPDALTLDVDDDEGDD